LESYDHVEYPFFFSLQVNFTRTVSKSIDNGVFGNRTDLDNINMLIQNNNTPNRIRTTEQFKKEKVTGRWRFEKKVIALYETLIGTHDCAQEI
jgi:hypothetical protein